MSDEIKETDHTPAAYKIEPVEFVEVMDEFSKLLEKIELYNPHVDKELIKKALRFAAIAHAGQRRQSGKPFIYHGIQTAEILADLHLDSVMIACGILHDVVEDTKMNVEDVYNEFGDEIGNIIDGLTKIAGLKLKSYEERQAENFRKMILHSAKDPRTLIVKFADRLHNMRTLQYLPPQRRERIAHETLEVFAPLAHRFGIYTIKTELEDLSFRWLYPVEYKKLSESIESSHKARDEFVEVFVSPIKEKLALEGIDSDVQWRMKHLYSIYKKMIRDSKELDEIFDIYAVRVVVSTVSECYHALGIIHSMYTPIIMRIKDFIATPKFNMYQSLHTTVVGKNGKMIEVQIRTKEMHQTAETGIAAHWRYKEGKVRPDEIDSFVEWLRKIVDWQKGTPEANEFMHELKMDLFQDEIFVFTPKGDLIKLPQGSTPVDFAFALHSEIGLHCSGAKINGRIAPLDTELKSGQWVDILTNPNKVPNQRWLDTVKTARARSVLRRWMKKQRYDESRELGLKMISKIEKQRGAKISDDIKDKLNEKFHQKNWEQFIVELGIGDISFHSIQHFFGLSPQAKKTKGTSEGKKEPGVSIEGLGDMLVKYAKCCSPLPGDKIIGYITRGKGLMVHRADCDNIRNYLEDTRLVDVSWGASANLFFVANIRIEAVDRKGLLSDITSAITKSNCDIRSAKAIVKDGMGIDDFEVDVKSLGDLQALMRDIRNVKSVMKVERLDKRTKETLKSSDE